MNRNLRIRALAAGAVMASTVLNAASAFADITYLVDRTVGLGSVMGSITTDGNTGTLGLSDFVAWDLKLNGPGASFTIMNTDSGAAVWGSPDSDVTATTKNLYFNFSGGPGYLVFQDNQGSGATYYCDSTYSGACFKGETVTPVFYSDSSTQNIVPTGKQSIGTTVPEPSTWALMLAGFAGLALAGYRQAGKVALALAKA